MVNTKNMKTIKKLQTRKIESKRKPFAVLFLFSVLLLLQTNAIGQEQACIECHKDMVEKKFIHGPVDVDCTFCHESNGEQHPNDNVKGFTIAEEGPDLCYSCHTEHHTANTTNTYGHSAVIDGDCLDCHEVHSSDEPKFISMNVPDLCNMCHYEVEETVLGLAVVHGPLKEKNSCVSCHATHSSAEYKLLKSSEKTLCLKCHNKTITTDNRIIKDISKKISEGTVVHAPLEDGCVTCHSPHASANSKLLTMSYPGGNYAVGVSENYELCFTCHDAESLTEATTTYVTNFRNGELNLHYLHVNKEKGRTCNNCHSVHGSLRKHLIAETVKFGRWDMPLNYVPTENGGSCSTGCHRDWKYDRTQAVVK